MGASVRAELHYVRDDLTYTWTGDHGDPIEVQEWGHSMSGAGLFPIAHIDCEAAITLTMAIAAFEQACDRWASLEDQEARAGDLRIGDWFREFGMDEWWHITLLDGGGDTVYVSYDGPTSGTSSIDRDTVVEVKRHGA